MEIKEKLKEAGFRVYEDTHPEGLLVGISDEQLFLNGTVVAFSEIVKVNYCHNISWDYDYDGDITEIADIYGLYRKSENIPTVYEYHEMKEYYWVWVDYLRDGEEKRVEVTVYYSPHWVDDVISYVRKRGEEYKQTLIS